MTEPLCLWGAPTSPVPQGAGLCLIDDVVTAQGMSCWHSGGTTVTPLVAWISGGADGGAPWARASPCWCPARPREGV